MRYYWKEMCEKLFLRKLYEPRQKYELDSGALRSDEKIEWRMEEKSSGRKKEGYSKN